MEIIDFDDHFSDYLNQWTEKNRAKYKRVEEMEDEVPNVYLRWLNKPAQWLGGKRPSEFFESYDAQTLANWLVDYVHSDAPVPDPLLNRLEELGEEEPLLALMRDEAAPCEARMHAIELLRQLDSRAPMVDYIRWQVERACDDDLLDNALESLHEMGADVRGPAMIAFAAASEPGKEALLDLLCDFPPVDDAVFQFALSQFKLQPDRRALFAGYLGKMDDDRALEALCDIAESDEVTYIDFIEIRNAIERLGGEAPIRDFRNDPTYRAVQRLQ
ncbi:MAG: hypothetical protein PHY12_14485 [Eubacteriales bacterium]|nr:hypothetical protein [Eubacteriales bacterium]